MKIAYLLHWNDSIQSGAFKKLLDQITFWCSDSHEARIFLVTRNKNLQNAVNTAELPCKAFVSVYGGIADRFFSYNRVVNQIIDFAPDVIYQRYDLYYPALSVLAAKFPVILEINSDDTEEYKNGSSLRFWYNRMTRGILLRKIRGMVYVTSELSERTHFSKFKKASVVIGNGIDLSKFRPIKYSPDSRCRFVFIGTAGQPWHGTDKIVFLAERFPDWQFDVIGLGQSDIGKRLDNLTAHGFLDKATYEGILAKADIAIGTLALHRICMTETCSLKVREYLAYGLPTLLGNSDVDFPEPSPFLLQLPNYEGNVEDNLPAIRKFCEQVKGTRVSHDHIRHLDVSYKEIMRLAFFRQVAAGTCSN